MVDRSARGVDVETDEVLVPLQLEAAGPGVALAATTTR